MAKKVVVYVSEDSGQLYRTVDDPAGYYELEVDVPVTLTLDDLVESELLVETLVRAGKARIL